MESKSASTSSCESHCLAECSATLRPTCGERGCAGPVASKSRCPVPATHSVSGSRRIATSPSSVQISCAGFFRRLLRLKIEPSGGSPQSFPSKFRSVRCAWSSSPRTSTCRSGRRSSRLRPRSAARARPCASGFARVSATAAYALAPRWLSSSASGTRARGARGARAAQDQRDPEAGQRVFRPGGVRPPSREVNAFIDEHRARCGVEPICTTLQVAPSAYRQDAARQRNPALLPQRAQRDALLLPEVRRSTRTCRSAAPTRSGASCTVRARPLRAALSSG